MSMDAQSKHEACENFKVNIIEKITPKYLKSVGITDKKADVVVPLMKSTCLLNISNVSQIPIT